MDCNQYISLFFSQFHPGIPWTIIIITIVLAICSSAYLYYKRSKQVILPWIVACLFLMLYATVIGRLGSSSGSSVHLMPFWSIQAIQEGYIETMYEKIYNVLFFVPYGFLNGLWYFDSAQYKFKVLSEERVHEGDFLQLMTTQEFAPVNISYFEEYAKGDIPNSENEEEVMPTIPMLFIEM